MSTVAIARERVVALMTAEEKHSIERKAAVAGVSVGELIRRSVSSFDPEDAANETALDHFAYELDRLNAVAAQSIDSAIEDLIQLNATLRQQNERA